MIRQEPRVQFLYENIDLRSLCTTEPYCQEADFAGFEDIHVKSSLNISKKVNLKISLRRDGPPEDHWLCKGVMKIVIWNENVEIDGTYFVTFCNETPFYLADLMSRKALAAEVENGIFNLEISIKFDKWEGLKVLKLFQFDHQYLDSDLNLIVQGENFHVRSKTLFQEIPAIREYLKQNFEQGTKKYIINDLKGHHSLKAFRTMLQVAFRCSFITNIHEVGEVLSIAFRFDYPELKRKCEYFLINEPGCDWFQKLIFADLYNLSLLKSYVMEKTVGLAQLYKIIPFHRFLSTETIAAITLKAIELKKMNKFGDEPATKYASLSIHDITENRWERLKRNPLCVGVPETDITATAEMFQSTLMPRHIGVELITPQFHFVEKRLNLFTYKVQLGPDHRLLFKIDWNDIQAGNFVWSVSATVFIRLHYRLCQKYEFSERVKFDYDHQCVFFDGLHILELFPGGVEHLLDGLGNNPTLPKIEIMVAVDKIEGLELALPNINLKIDEEMDDDWILQPSRNQPIVCCGKYLYVDKDVLRDKSRIFSNILQQTYEPITVPLSAHKFDSFSLFLDILHGEDVYFNYNNVFNIVEFARSFECEDIIQRAVDWLIEEPGKGKLEKLELSEKYSVPELQRLLIESIIDIEELFDMLRQTARFNRRMLQILQDRLANLPIQTIDEDF